MPRGWSWSFRGLESGLKPSYDFPGMPVGTIRVSPLGGPGGAGVKIEVPLRGATLQGWEAAAEGMVVLLAGSPAPAASPVRGPYRLGVGDRLEISVFGHEDMRQDLEVLADGTVALPMVGVVPVAGKTVSELRGELEAKLKDYLVDPQVSLDIKDYKSQPVNVVGEVKNPGQYYLKGPTTLVDIIALAGWMTANAGGEVILTRHETDPGKGTEMRQIVVRKEDLVGSGQAHNNPLVQAGDVVTVGPKQYFYIRGEVAKPGQYPLEDHPTLMKAISIAQGLTQYRAEEGDRGHPDGERGPDQDGGRPEGHRRASGRGHSSPGRRPDSRPPEAVLGPERAGNACISLTSAYHLPISKPSEGKWNPDLWKPLTGLFPPTRRKSISGTTGPPSGDGDGR